MGGQSSHSLSEEVNHLFASVWGSKFHLYTGGKTSTGSQARERRDPLVSKFLLVYGGITYSVARTLVGFPW